MLPTQQIMLPTPPAEYSQAYMDQLMSALSLQFRMMNQLGMTVSARVTITNLPTSADGLKKGELYSTGDGIVRVA